MSHEFLAFLLVFRIIPDVWEKSSPCPLALFASRCVLGRTRMLALPFAIVSSAVLVFKFSKSMHYIAFNFMWLKAQVSLQWYEGGKKSDLPGICISKIKTFRKQLVDHERCRWKEVAYRMKEDNAAHHTMNTMAPLGTLIPKRQHYHCWPWKRMKWYRS